jgi:hypothetical protein
VKQTCASEGTEAGRLTPLLMTSYSIYQSNHQTSIKVNQVPEDPEDPSANPEQNQEETGKEADNCQSSAQQSGCQLALLPISHQSVTMTANLQTGNRMAWGTCSTELQEQ